MSLLNPEPTRYDLHFRLFSFPVRVHPAFWIVQGVMGLMLARFAGAIYFFIWIGCVFVSVLIHELGHALTAWKFGADPEIVLTALGGLATGVSDVYGRRRRILVYLAGPAAQLLLAGAVFVSGLALGAVVDWRTSLFSPEMVVTPSADGESYDVDWKPSRWLPLAITMMMLMGINIGWPLFNLLPVPPLDGGMVLKEFFDWNLYGNRPPWEQDPNWWKRR